MQASTGKTHNPGLDGARQGWNAIKAHPQGGELADFREGEDRSENSNTKMHVLLQAVLLGSTHLAAFRLRSDKLKSACLAAFRLQVSKDWLLHHTPNTTQHLNAAARNTNTGLRDKVTAGS